MSNRDGQQAQSNEVLNYSVNEAVSRAGISRATFYKLLSQKEGPLTLRIGRRRLVPREQLEIWLLNLTGR
jgi:excisionase family DNA binding protein